MGSCVNCDDDGFCMIAGDSNESLGIDEKGRCVDEVNCPEYFDETIMYDDDFDD